MFRLLIALFCSPLTWLLTKIKPGVRVLMYHRITNVDAYDQLTVSVDSFEYQLASLSASSRVISIDEALEELHQGKRLRQSGVVISFDDGYLDNLEQALPILERYELPAIIFITTRFADQTESHPRYKAATSGASPEPLHLNWHQLAHLVKHPLISIGSHTLSHPYLQSVSSEQARAEILESARELERRLGVPVRHFCYPSGDYAERELEILGQSDYCSAVTVAPGVNVPGKFQPFEIRRTEVTDRDVGLMFKLKLIGALDMVHQLLHLRRKKQFRTKAAQRGSDAQSHEGETKLAAKYEQ